jgi:hypothetical protein
MESAVLGHGKVQLVLAVKRQLPFQFFRMPEVVHIQEADQFSSGLCHGRIAWNGGEGALVLDL